MVGQDNTINGKEEDPSVVMWKTVLPVMDWKRVLKIGTENHNTIKTILGWSCDLLTCVGPEIDLAGHNLTYSNRPEDIEGLKFNLCLIDEPSSLMGRKTKNEVIFMLRQLLECLDEDGVLVLTLPNGFHLLNLKIQFHNIIKQLGVKHVNSFICLPSFKTPTHIFPFSKNTDYARKVVCEKFTVGTRGKRLVKMSVKWAIMKMMPLCSPFYDMMIIMTRSERLSEENEAERLLGGYYAQRKLRSDEMFSVWGTQSSAEKQIGLIYYGEGDKKELLGVCKQSRLRSGRAEFIRKEFWNLNLLFEHRDELEKNSITVPRPIHLEADHEKIISIESAIKGYPLEILKWEMMRQHNFGKFSKEMEKLISIHSVLRKVYGRIRRDIARIPMWCFSRIEMSVEWLENEERLDLYSDNVQHGDFTDVNLIYNVESKQWGIIDWEWLYSGFPYLFDLFYLFMSFEYHEKKIKSKTLMSRYFESFVDTYFRRNWFSNYFTKAALSYCDEVKIAKEYAFNYFLDFLLVNYNKNKYGYYRKEYTDLFEEMLRYSIANRDKYVLE